MAQASFAGGSQSLAILHAPDPLDLARRRLVAPPATLGDLREALAKGVRACVTAEVAQDLVKIPASQLQSHLVDVLPLKAPRARTQARARAAK